MGRHKTALTRGKEATFMIANVDSLNALQRSSGYWQRISNGYKDRKAYTTWPFETPKPFSKLFEVELKINSSMLEKSHEKLIRMKELQEKQDQERIENAAKEAEPEKQKISALLQKIKIAAPPLSTIFQKPVTPKPAIPAVSMEAFQKPGMVTMDDTNQSEAGVHWTQQATTSDSAQNDAMNPSNDAWNSPEGAATTGTWDEANGNQWNSHNAGGWGEATDAEANPSNISDVGESPHTIACDPESFAFGENLVTPSLWQPWDTLILDEWASAAPIEADGQSIAETIEQGAGIPQQDQGKGQSSDWEDGLDKAHIADWVPEVIEIPTTGFDAEFGGSEDSSQEQEEYMELSDDEFSKKDDEELVGPEDFDQYTADE